MPDKRCQATYEVLPRNFMCCLRPFAHLEKHVWVENLDGQYGPPRIVVWSDYSTEVTVGRITGIITKEI